MTRYRCFTCGRFMNYYDAHLDSRCRDCKDRRCEHVKYGGPVSGCPACEAAQVAEGAPMTTNDAAQLLRELVTRQAMGYAERFEVDAEAFYQETRLLAPGRSVPAAMYSDDYERRRHEKWDEWNQHRADRWTAAMAQAAYAIERLSAEKQALDEAVTEALKDRDYYEQKERDAQIDKQNAVTRAVDEERRRWYIAIDGVGWGGASEGLAPEVAVENLSIELSRLKARAEIWAQECSRLEDEVGRLSASGVGHPHTCHDMNPPFPYPCAACEREKAGSSDRIDAFRCADGTLLRWPSMRTASGAEQEERERLEAARARAYALHLPNKDEAHPAATPKPEASEKGGEG